MLSLILLPMLALAPAQPSEGGKFVVLVRADSGEVPAGWNEALQGVATSAASEMENAEVLPPPQVGLSEVELAVGCEGWGPKCAGKIALMLDADFAVVGQITERGKGAWFTTTIFDRDGKVVRAAQRYELPDRASAGLELARDAVRAAIKGESPTTLLVETDVPGVTVFVDGKRVGQTPWVGRKIEPGEHEVRLELEGRAPMTKKVTLEPGETERVAVVMSSGPNPVRTSAVAGGQSDSSEVGLVSPPLAWTMVGVGAAVVALGIGVMAAGVANHVVTTPMSEDLWPLEEKQMVFLKRMGSPYIDGSPPYGYNQGALEATTGASMLGGVVCILVGGISAGSGAFFAFSGGAE